MAGAGLAREVGRVGTGRDGLARHVARCGGARGERVRLVAGEGSAGDGRAGRWGGWGQERSVGVVRCGTEGDVDMVWSDRSLGTTGRSSYRQRLNLSSLTLPRPSFRVVTANANLDRIVVKLDNCQYSRHRLIASEQKIIDRAGGLLAIHNYKPKLDPTAQCIHATALDEHREILAEVLPSNRLQHQRCSVLSGHGHIQHPHEAEGKSRTS